MKLWCFEDPQDWGSRLYRAAKERGVDVQMFETSHEPDEGYVFVHMHHHPNLRSEHKRLMQNLSLNHKLTLIPDYRSSVLYDDKLEQARWMAKWMPPTKAFFTPTAAKDHLRHDAIELPFISKSAEGASSNNVRLIETHKQAWDEVKMAFSDRGIPMHYEKSQLGYVLWQKFIADNDHDVRVIAVGSKRMVLRRYNRKDRPMASGSGNLWSVKEIDEEVSSALTFSDCFFRHERFDWCGIDLVRDADRWYVLETTVGWNMGGYIDCVFWQKTSSGWAPTNRTGRDIWEVLIDEIEGGAFDMKEKAA